MTDPRDEMAIDDDFRQRYRALSNETTPDSLDRAVLTAARPAARGVVTLRPFAMAAVVVLGLGLALEFTLFDSAREAAVMTPPNASVERPEDAERLRRVPPPAAEQDIGPRLKVEQPMAVEAEPDRQSPAVDFGASSRGAEPNTGRSSSDDLGAVLDTLEESRLDSKAAVSESLERAPMMISPPQPPRDCDETRTTDAESWFLCVTELRRAGRDDAADRELSLLRSKYPDFQVR